MSAAVPLPPDLGAAEAPAWSLQGSSAPPIEASFPRALGDAPAWAGADGTGVRVAVLDSGVDAAHPGVEPIGRAVAVEYDADGEPSVVADTGGDLSGHGTAVAGIVRAVAPGCELWSVRVLGADFRGRGSALLAGIEWALAEGAQVINLSLSSSRATMVDALRELSDQAWFARVVLVCSAHNVARLSAPWRFSNVISVGSHEHPAEPLRIFANPEPPVSVYAPGVDIRVAWPGGAVHPMTGNSFATPHVAGLCARILQHHPGATPAEVHTLLRLGAENVSNGT